MATIGSGALRTFRQKFLLPSMDVLRWFPGHMHKSMNQIQAQLKDVDCVVEVHDSRIPFSGRNPRFRDIISLRPHALLLSKFDLAEYDSVRQKKVTDKLRSDGVDTVFFTNLMANTTAQFLRQTLLPELVRLTESRPRYSRQGLPEYNILVIGVPNVGKSTFINAARWSNIRKKGRATAVGAKAGVTKSVLNRIRVGTEPLTYITDTPGLLTPQVPSLEEGMRLAACSCIPDHLVGEDNIADYVLFWLNHQQRFQYVQHFGLQEPTDDVMELLYRVAVNRGMAMRILDQASKRYVMKPDFKQAAVFVLKSFREGNLGKVMLDVDQIS